MSYAVVTYTIDSILSLFEAVIGINSLSCDINFVKIVASPKFSGYVHSVYHKAVNITCNTTGEMLTLLCNQMDNGPNSLIVDLRSFENLGIEAHDWVRIKEDYLLIASRLNVQLPHSGLWRCDLPSFPDQTQMLKANLKVATEYMKHYGKHSGMLRLCTTRGDIESTLTKMLDARVKGLLDAVAKGNSVNAFYYASRLVGLGYGLTPSGDDFLVGLFTVMNMPNSPLQSFSKWCKQIVDAAYSFTNEISYATLIKAASGMVRESIVRFVMALIEEYPQQMVKSLDRVLKIGSTSGTDIALGITSGFGVALKGMCER